MELQEDEIDLFFCPTDGWHPHGRVSATVAPEEITFQLSRSFTAAPEDVAFRMATAREPTANWIQGWAGSLTARVSQTAPMDWTPVSPIKYNLSHEVIQILS